MAGIQVSGLSSGINWQSIITELVTADSAGINAVKTQQAKVNLQGSALGSLGTDLTNLSSAVFTLEDSSTYGGVVAGSTTANSTWISSAQNGTQIGNTVLDVSQLATTAQLQGTGDISSALNSTSVCSPGSPRGEPGHRPGRSPPAPLRSTATRSRSRPPSRCRTPLTAISFMRPAARSPRPTIPPPTR